MLTQGQLRTLQVAGAATIRILEKILPRFQMADEEEEQDDSDAEEPVEDADGSHSASVLSSRPAPKSRFFFAGRHLTPEQEAEKRAAKLRKAEEKRARKAAKDAKRAAAGGRKAKRRQRGGFVERTTFVELLPQLISSLHVHVETVSLQLSRLTGSAAHQALLKSQGIGHLLLAATINDVIFHRFFAHAPGAALPHSPDSSAVWAEHDAWLSRIRPWQPNNALATDPRYAELRQYTNIVYVRRVLIVADGAQATTEQDSAAREDAAGSAPHAVRRRASRANTIKAVFSNRQRAVILQPADADQPPLLTLVSTELQPLRRKAEMASMPPPQTRQSLYVHVTPVLVGADPHALFQVAKFVADSLEPQLIQALKVFAPASAAQPPPQQSLVSPGSSGHTPAGTTHNARPQSSTRPLSTVSTSSSLLDSQQTPADSLPPRMMVVIEPLVVQLPRIGAEDDALGLELSIQRCIITSCPWSSHICTQAHFVDGLYDTWLESNPHSFPSPTSAAASTSVLPPASQLLHCFQDDELPSLTPAAGAQHAEFAPSKPASSATAATNPPLFIVAQQVACRTLPFVSPAAAGQSSATAPPPPAADQLLSPFDVMLAIVLPTPAEQAPGSDSSQTTLSPTTATANDDRKAPAASAATTHVILRVLTPLQTTIARQDLVYILRLVDSLQSLPFPELAEAFATLSVEKAAADPAETRVFMLVPRLAAGLVDLEGNNVLTANLHGTQLAVAAAEGQDTSIRVVAEKLALDQPAVTSAEEILAQSTSTASLELAPAEDKPPAIASSGDPQVRVLVTVPAVPQELQGRYFDAYQARKLQLRSILVLEESQRQLAARQKAAQAGSRDSAGASRPRAQPVGNTSSVSGRSKLDMALDAVGEEAADMHRRSMSVRKLGLHGASASPDSGASGGASKVPAHSSSSSSLVDVTALTVDEAPPDDGAEVDSTMGDDDFAAVDPTSLKPYWLQAESWSADPATKHHAQHAGAKAQARQMLEDVNVFLRHSGHRGLLETPLRPYLAPAPPPLATNPELEYDVLPVLPQPKIVIRAADLSLDLDTVPLQSLGPVFDLFAKLPSGDDPHVLPPTNMMPVIDVDVQNLRLRILDGSVLQRLGLFRAMYRPMLMADASTLLVVPTLQVHISDRREITITSLSKGSLSSTTAGSTTPAAAEEIEALRRQLAAARAEASEARRLLLDSYQALQVSVRRAGGVRDLIGASSRRHQAFFAFSLVHFLGGSKVKLLTSSSVKAVYFLFCCLSRRLCFLSPTPPLSLISAGERRCVNQSRSPARNAACQKALALSVGR